VYYEPEISFVETQASQYADSTVFANSRRFQERQHIEAAFVKGWESGAQYTLFASRMEYAAMMSLGFVVAVFLFSLLYVFVLP
jgi:hypothetical protein